MLSAAQTAEIAGRLDEAERTRRPIGQLSLEFPGFSILEAYAVQKAWIDLKTARGRQVKGHKIGLTSRAMQAAVGIDEPDYGVLLDDMFFADGDLVPVDRFMQLKIEAELAFVLAKPLRGPDCTLDDVIAATDFIVPAMEILDARIQRVDPPTGTLRKVVDTIADNAANAGLVLGGRRFRSGDADMRWVGAICTVNGAVEETGLAAGVLGHPANGIAWLANRLAPHGVTLEPGHVLLAGSFIRPIDVKKGDAVVADFGRFGTVSCNFG